MMWFIQRQISGGSSADKRRKPKKQRVGFDDVQGVDEAKEELVEVNVAFVLITSLRCLMNVARQKNFWYLLVYAFHL